MTIKLVKNSDDVHQFLKVPLELYKGHKYWIRPLDKDVLSTFDSQKNSFAKKDNITRWLLLDNDKKSIGRIAAFINKKTMLKNNAYPVGGVGYFECINDQKAANLLFDTAKKWLIDKQVEAMDGPINLGARDKFWGLLTEGFEMEPNYLANYNFAYYKELFETYGFKEYFNQFTFSRVIADPFKPEYEKKAQQVLENPAFSFETIQPRNLKRYIEEFKDVYNKAWAGHSGLSEMKSSQARGIINSLKPVLDKHTAWFGYHNQKPIAFFISVPEVNQVFKHVNGKLNLWGKLQFLKSKWFRTNKKMLGIIFGVIPEFDGKGVTQAITIKAAERIRNKTNYEFLELHGIGDFNPGMLKFVKKLGVTDATKAHTTYRYLFDRNRVFERMPLKTKT